MSTFRLRVSRPEPEPPPPILVDQRGDWDLTDRREYFEKRRTAFVGAARCVFDRLIKFNRYRLGMIKARSSTDVAPAYFDNPSWVYCDGAPLAVGGKHITIVLQLPTHPDSWGIGVLEPAAAGKLTAALVTPVEVPLHRELQALGKDAALSGDLRRGVIELATACCAFPEL
ncbi:MAG TPA: hypothetical protein VLH75_17185 [Longimicrobiales bacterium]|nr:hypothetical protein [Longimicrobiales bacterium]